MGGTTHSPYRSTKGRGQLIASDGPCRRYRGQYVNNYNDLVTNWLSRNGTYLVLIIGENGAGKSRLLAEVANRAKRSRHLALVCNTPFDRFPHRGPRVSKLLASRGKELPKYAIRKAIQTAQQNDSIRLRRIPRVLSHCGYRPTVGFRVKDFRFDADELRSKLRAREVERDLIERIVGACSVFGKVFDGHRIAWLDFIAHELDFTATRVLTELMEYERLLRQSGVLEEIEFFLQKDDTVFPLREASSGELSLITSMVFLATVVHRDSVILVDEPENSLHPKWQREYVELLMSIVEYEEPTVVIATHAPLVVSAASTEHKRHRIEVVRLGMSGEEMLGADVGNVEKLLVEAFDTVTPANHYLSESVVDLIDQLTESPQRLAQVLAKIDQYFKSSTDDRQREALNGAKQLAIRVANGSA